MSASHKESYLVRCAVVVGLAPAWSREARAARSCAAAQVRASSRSRPSRGRPLHRGSWGRRVAAAAPARRTGSTTTTSSSAWPRRPASRACLRLLLSRWDAARHSSASIYPSTPLPWNPRHPEISLLRGGHIAPVSAGCLMDNRRPPPLSFSKANSLMSFLAFITVRADKTRGMRRWKDGSRGACDIDIAACFVVHVRSAARGWKNHRGDTETERDTHACASTHSRWLLGSHCIYCVLWRWQIPVPHPSFAQSI